MFSSKTLTLLLKSQFVYSCFFSFNRINPHIDSLTCVYKYIIPLFEWVIDSLTCVYKYTIPLFEWVSDRQLDLCIKVHHPFVWVSDRQLDFVYISTSSLCLSEWGVGSLTCVYKCIIPLFEWVSDRQLDLCI
jgi:hypothetical protein